MIDAAGTKKVFVLHAERERPAAVSFVDRDLQLLVVGSEKPSKAKTMRSDPLPRTRIGWL